MTLTDEQRRDAWEVFMSDISRSRSGIAINNADLRAAVNAVDDWVEANQPSFNQALPLPARTELSADLKAQLLLYVVRKRYEVS